jgi:hypothetical protein
MEKKTKYQKLITDLLEEYADSFQEPDIEAQVICDYQRNHYQLVKVGWDKGRRYHYCVFHFDIINGKIWLQENRTDIRIAIELEERGVPKSDIVLAIHAPEARIHTAYSAA